MPGIGTASSSPIYGSASSCAPLAQGGKMSQDEAAAVAQVVAAAEREFGSYEVTFLGGDAASRAWDVADAVGPQRVEYVLTTAAYRCDCRSFAVGGLGTCVHVEIVRLYLARRKAANEAAKANSKPAPTG